MSVQSQNDPIAAVREEWLFDITAQLQQALCDAALAGTERHALVLAVSDLPAPASRVEELVLGGLLLEISVGSRGRTSRELVQRAETLAAAFERRPSLSIAQRAADEICRNYRLPLRINGLAEQLACDQTALRRQFHFEYGTDLRDYHLRARIQAAVRLMCADCPKIAAIATSVGYSSEKNFYRNTREITGHTPGELKRIGPNQLRTLADRLLPQRKVP